MGIAGNVVGTAEVVVTANTAGFEKEAVEGTEPGFQAIGTEAEKAGEDAGTQLSTGVKKKTDGIESDLEKKGKSGGSKLADGLKNVLSSVGVPEALLGGWGALAVGVAGVTAVTIHLGEQMQATETQIQNVTGQSKASVDKLGDAFLNTGFKSEFSGQQWAAAYASVAGQLKTTEGHVLDTKDAVTVMSAASELAAAKQIELGDATSTLSSVMQAFQVPVAGAKYVTDLLYNTSNATGQSIDALGASMDKIRAKLGAAAPPISDMATLLVNLTSHGETGRSAMTALSTAFNGLVTPTTAAIAAQKFLGVSFDGLNGKLLPMRDIIGELQPKIAGMSDVQATATLKALGFGTAANTLLTTIRGGTGDWDKYSKQVEKNGTVSSAAERNAKTMHGTFETLKAGISDLATKLGTQLVPWITKLGQALVGVVQWVIANWPEIEKAFDNLWNHVKPFVMFTVNGLKDILKFAKGLIDFISGIFSGNWSKAWKGLQEIVQGVVDFILDIFRYFYQELNSSLGNALAKVVNFFKRLPGQIVNALGDLATTIWHALDGSVQWIDKNIVMPLLNFWTGLPNKMLSALGDVVSTVFSSLIGADTWIYDNVVQPIINVFKNIPSELGNALSEGASLVWDGLKDVINPLIDGMNKLINGVNAASGFISFGAIPKIPDIPKLAGGGYVAPRQGGVLALLSEGGEGESVVPDSKRKAFAQGVLGMQGGSSKNITINGGINIVPPDGADAYEYGTVIGAKLRML